MNKIHTNIPYRLDSNLGRAYNDFMKKVPENEWALFLDHDAMFTTKYWYRNLHEVIDNNKNYGLFYGMTNRIYPKNQKFKDVSESNHDIRYHRQIGISAWNTYGSNVNDVSNSNKGFQSGVIILINKSTWNKVGGFVDGFLGVDNDIHKKCIDNNIKVGIMKGIYVYHWYRGDGDTSHLKNYEKNMKTN